RLQPVEIQGQDRDRPWASLAEPFRQMRYQRPTVVQAGQIVVLSQIPQLFFSRDTGLKLRKQGGDGLESVDLFLLPLPSAELDEAEYPGGHVARDQRRRGHRGRG